MKIIDVHIHFGAGEGFDRAAEASGQLNSAEFLGRTLAACGVEKAIAMGTRRGDAPAICAPQTPDLSGKLDLERYNQPDFIVYCCGVDSSTLPGCRLDESLAEFERHLRTSQCVGIKMYTGYNHLYPNDPIHHPFYELARAYDVPVVLHTGDTAGTRGLVKYSHPLAVDELAMAFPDVRFVMAHYGNPWIVDATEVAIKNPNVFIDLSGLAAGDFTVDGFLDDYRGYVEHLRTWMTYLSDYGKFMYGSDWPLVRIDTYIELIRRLTPEKYHPQIFYENARRVFTRL